jgi:hypothetical protein
MQGGNSDGTEQQEKIDDFVRGTANQSVKLNTAKTI